MARPDLRADVPVRGAVPASRRRLRRRRDRGGAAGAAGRRLIDVAVFGVRWAAWRSGSAWVDDCSSIAGRAARRRDLRLLPEEGVSGIRGARGDGAGSRRHCGYGRAASATPPGATFRRPSMPPSGLPRSTTSRSASRRPRAGPVRRPSPMARAASASRRFRAAAGDRPASTRSIDEYSHRPVMLAGVGCRRPRRRSLRTPAWCSAPTLSSPMLRRPCRCGRSHRQDLGRRRRAGGLASVGQIRDPMRPVRQPIPVGIADSRRRRDAG